MLERIFRNEWVWLADDTSDAHWASPLIAVAMPSSKRFATVQSSVFPPPLAQLPREGHPSGDEIEPLPPQRQNLVEAKAPVSTR
jgi:hypothetical protein